MNFDELKSKWDKEKRDDVHIPQDMTKLRMAQHPLDKFKRNMRNEFYVQNVAILFLATLPYVFNLQNNFHYLYFILYAMLVLISAFYMCRFYRFYNSMQDYSTNTKDGLLRLYYELRLNMERYKSFSFSLLPFAISFLGLYFYDQLLAGGNSLESLSDYNLLLIMVFVAILTLFFMLITNWWINSFYGKYTNQIRNILDELKEE